MVQPVPVLLTWIFLLVQRSSVLGWKKKKYRLSLIFHQAKREDKNKKAFGFPESYRHF